LSRNEIQELAQKHGIPASFKTATIIERLMKQVTPKAEVVTNTFHVDFIPLAPLDLAQPQKNYLANAQEVPVTEVHNLEGKKISPQEFYEHIERQEIPPTTQGLLLSGNSLRDEGIPIVISCFQFLQLSLLDLEGNFITDNGVGLLFSSLFGHPTLRSLSLAENILYHCPMLAEFLENNNVIERLNLSGNKIRDDTIIFIAHSLKMNRSLISLNLSDNELTQESVTVFCDILEENQALDILLLNGNFININTASELLANISMRLELNTENRFRWFREGRGEY